MRSQLRRLAVTFANIYMGTHNAPVPLIGLLPPSGHAGRFALQAWLLSIEWASSGR